MLCTCTTPSIIVIANSHIIIVYFVVKSNIKLIEKDVQADRGHIETMSDGERVRE